MANVRTHFLSLHPATNRRRYYWHDTILVYVSIREIQTMVIHKTGAIVKQISLKQTYITEYEQKGRMPNESYIDTREYL